MSQLYLYEQNSHKTYIQFLCSDPLVFMKSMRKILYKLNMDLKNWKKLRQSYPLYFQNISSIMNFIYTLLEQNYTKFPYFNFLFQQYSKLSDKKLLIVDIQEYFQQNQALQNNIKIIRQKYLVNEKELKPTNLIKFQNFFSQPFIYKDYNPQCLICTKSFYFHQKLSHEYQLNHLLFCYQKFNLQQLHLAICSLLNTGKPSVILIGISNNTVIGKKINKEKQLEKINFIHTILEKLTNFQIESLKAFRKLVSISFIEVLQNPLEQNLSFKKGRTIIRISIKAIFTKKLFFFKQKRGSGSTFYTCLLSNQLPYKIHQKDLYYSIVKSFFQKKEYQLHRNQDCQRIIDFDVGDSCSESQAQQSQILQVFDKFSYQTMIKLTSTKKNYIVEEKLAEELIISKYRFQLNQPFKEIYEKQNMSFWLLSHQQKPELMINKKCAIDPDNKIISSFYKIQKYLKVEISEDKIFKIQDLFHILEKKWNQHPAKVQKLLKRDRIFKEIYLGLSSQKIAFFTYLYLENKLKLRPLFIQSQKFQFLSH